MKKFLLPAFSILSSTLMLSCGKTTTINSNMDLTGKWVLESIVQNQDTIKKPALSKGLMEVSLMLKEKGEMEAISSTNFLTGFYETAQENTIQMGGGGTEKKDTAWGDMFVNAIPEVNLYDLTPNRLILHYSDNNQLIFARGK